MSNPLINGMKSAVENSNIAQLITAYKYAKNPKEIMNNPQLQSILRMYKGDAKTAFYELCKQKGVDPQSILSQLK